MGQSLDANMKSTWQITQSPVGGLGRTGGKERNFPCGPTQGVPPESPSPRLFPTCIGDLLSPGTVQCLCLSSDCCNKNIIDWETDTTNNNRCEFLTVMEAASLGSGCRYSQALGSQALVCPHVAFLGVCTQTAISCLLLILKGH